MYIHIYIITHAYIHIHTYTYIHTFTHTYTYIHIYTYIHTHNIYIRNIIQSLRAFRRAGIFGNGLRVCLHNELMYDGYWKDNVWYQHSVINPKGMQACTWMDPSPKVRPRDPPVDPDGAIGGARNQPFWGTKTLVAAVGSKMSQMAFSAFFACHVKYALHDSNAIIAPREKT